VARNCEPPWLRDDYGLIRTGALWDHNFLVGFTPVTGSVDTVCVGFGDDKKRGSNCTILVDPPRVCSKEQEVGPVLLGVANRPVSVVKRCICSAHNALCNRHGGKQPQFTAEFHHFDRFLDDVMPDVESVYNQLYSYWDTKWWGKWSKPKVDSIIRDCMNAISRPDRVAAHVKFEIMGKWPLTKGRLIQANVNQVAQSYTGPECTAIQKAYCKILYRRSGKNNPRVRVTFASGMSPADLGKWMGEVLREMPGCKFYERDGASWDSTIQRKHHDLKMRATRFSTEGYKKIVEAGFTVVGHVDCRGRVTRGYMKYKLIGTVKSGHNDTTLGNSLINAGIAYEVMTIMGLEGDIIVVGDDLLIAIKGDFDADRFAELESSFGIRPEYRKFHSYMDVSFISGVWFHAGDCQYAFTPKPGRLFARLFWTLNPPGKKINDYLHSIVSGLLPTCGRLPVVGTFLRSHDRDGKIISLGSRLYTFLGADSTTVDPQALRADFILRYHTNSSEIDTLERELEELGGSRGILKSPLFDRIVEYDNADILERPVHL